MPEYDSPHEKLRQEFGVLLGRNNAIMRETPAYTIAQLFQLVDHERRKHGIEIDDVRDEGDGRYLILMDDESQAAAIGLDSADDLADIDAMMLDDRRVGGLADV